MEGPRGVRKEEFDDLVKLVNLTFRPERQSMQREHESIFNEENLEHLRVIVEDGKPVSHIGTLEKEVLIYNCKSKVGLVGSVCTHPDYRGRGYATLLLNDCIRRFNEHGCDFMLVSGARRLYDSADCLSVGNVIRLEIMKRDLWRFERNKATSIEDFSEKYLEDMMKSYEKKKVRFIRERKDWEIGLRCGQVMNVPSDFLIIKENSKFKGYLIVNFSGGRGDVKEYGGDRQSLIGAIPILFEKYQLDALTFPIPFEDREFAGLIQDRGVHSSVTPINAPCTVRVLNFSRFMERARPYFREKLGDIAEDLKFEEKGEEYKISLGKEDFIIKGRRAMTWTILSRPGGYEITGEGRVIEAIRNVLPIPFLWYGINFI
ncbi:MAG: GNAT family N-acetyltransferase [Candidatus Omnitrophica bacterium]|nr:GNAT family N-acetyltransferase [Candidatus Omnitrophota bacterium]